MRLGVFLLVTCLSCHTRSIISNIIIDIIYDFAYKAWAMLDTYFLFNLQTVIRHLNNVLENSEKLEDWRKKNIRVSDINNLIIAAKIIHEDLSQNINELQSVKL